MVENEKNIAEKLHSISEQAKIDQAAEEEKRDKIRQQEEERKQQEEERKFDERIKQIHQKAQSEAEKGETQSYILRLNRGGHGEFMDINNVRPSELQGDERKLAEVLQKEGFTLYVRFGELELGGGMYCNLNIRWDKKE